MVMAKRNAICLKVRITLYLNVDNESRHKLSADVDTFLMKNFQRCINKQQWRKTADVVVVKNIR